jgi:hypothetical protein
MNLPSGQEEQREQREGVTDPGASLRGFGLNDIDAKPVLTGLFLLVMLIQLAVGTSY